MRSARSAFVSRFYTFALEKGEELVVVNKQSGSQIAYVGRVSKFPLEDGEVPIPAYEAMQRAGRLGSRILEILLRGVSERLCERRFDGMDILVIYLDGLVLARISC